MLGTRRDKTPWWEWMSAVVAVFSLLVWIVTDNATASLVMMISASLTACFVAFHAFPSKKKNKNLQK